jgi:membrane associated rhomboid family serine protease
MYPYDQNAATPAAGLFSGSVTKISIGIVAAMAIVSFLGYLPKFTPYFTLTLHSFTLPVPKFWVLLTSTFYCSSLFSGVLSGVLLVLLAKVVEPIVGSKEFLRLYLMIGFFTNILVLLFAFIAYEITHEPLLLIRPFETRSAPSAAIMMTMANLFLTVDMPLPCGKLPIRLMPFISLCISLVMGVFSYADDLIASVFGTILSYIYIRFIKKRETGRGDPNFDITFLLPGCGMGGTPPEAESDGNDPEMPEGMDELDGERRSYRYDPHGRPPPPPGGGDGNSPFQGPSRTVGG